MGSPLQQRSFWRSGPDHRALLGAAVPDFLTVRRWFDFRSVAIGAWVTREEHEFAAAHFFDALGDLVHILAGRHLNGQEQLVLGQLLISQRGTLALQYGTGGRPGSAAHYDPAQRTFSLAKNAGPGSIAHEWFHAFDHFIAAKMFEPAIDGRLASSLWLEGPVRDHRLNHLLADCYRRILLANDGESASELVQRSRLVDELLGSRYFSRPEELAARSFEAFVQDAGIRNAFLVRGTRQSEEARMGLYPRDEQRQLINQAFALYFSELCRSLLRNIWIEPEASPVPR